MEIVVHLLAEIAVFIQGGKIGGFTFVTAAGIGGAGNGAINTQAHLFRLHLGDRHNVDATQERRGFLHAGHDGLRNGRFNAEFLVQVTSIDAVQLGDTA
ncbi:hypothetical protein D3C80_1484180 [compost metagenome]